MEIEAIHAETGLSEVVVVEHDDTVGALKRRIGALWYAHPPRRLALRIGCGADTQHYGVTPEEDGTAISSCGLQAGDTIYVTAAPTPDELSEVALLIKMAESIAGTTETLLHRGQHLTVRGLLNKADTLDPDSDAVKARLYVADNWAEECKLAVYSEAVCLDPNYCVAYNNLGVALHSTENVTLRNGVTYSKTQLLKRAIHTDPVMSRPYTNLAGCLETEDTKTTLEDGSIMTKKQLLVRAIAKDPADEKPRVLLSSLLPHNGTVTLEDGSILTKAALGPKRVQEADGVCQGQCLVM